MFSNYLQKLYYYVMLYLLCYAFTIFAAQVRQQLFLSNKKMRNIDEYVT